MKNTDVARIQKQSKKCLVIVRGVPRNSEFPVPFKTLLTTDIN